MPSSEPLGAAEYEATQGRLLVVAAFVRELPLEGFLAACARAHAIGPVLDPTTYRQALPNLTALEELARALRGVQEAADRHAKPLRAVAHTPPAGAALLVPARPPKSALNVDSA